MKVLHEALGLYLYERNSRTYLGVLLDPGVFLAVLSPWVRAAGAGMSSSYTTFPLISLAVASGENVSISITYSQLQFMLPRFSFDLPQVLNQYLGCSMAAHFSAPTEARTLLCVSICSRLCHLCARGRQLFLGSARISAKEGSVSILLSNIWSARAPSLSAIGSPVFPADEGAGNMRVEAPPPYDTTDAKAAPTNLRGEQHVWG